MRAGQIIGERYRLEERLGAGGHGEVWRAADLRLHERPVALKRTRHDGDEGGAERVRREARSLSRISHPHVVAVHDVVDDADEVWVVMEHVAGRTLAETGPLSPAAAARYGAQLAGGLAAAHAHGILHRDVKPANVLVTDDGFAKLADFGISRPLHDEETVTATGALTGTPGYLAPEVAKGGRFTEAADVWSLGATLYRAVEGTTPFGDDNAHALLWKTVTQDVRPPERAGELEPVLLRLLARRAGDRPRLERARQELATLAGEPAAGVGPTPQRRRWHLRRGLVAGVVAGALVLAAGAWFARDRVLAQDGASGTPDAAGLAAPRASAAIVGDPVTADPCSLIDLDAMGEFGLTRTRTDNGELNTCEVVITRDDGAIVAVGATMWHNNEKPGEPNRRFGRVVVVDDEYEMPEECSRELFLPGGDYNISLDVWQETWDQTSESAGDVDNLCEIADATLNHATSLLNDGLIPRRTRPFAEGSLYTVDACELLRGEPLSRLPGVDVAHPLVGFAGWECRWEVDDGKDLRVLFQFDDPLTEDDGDRYVFDGHEAFVRGDWWSADSCLVDVVNRVAVSEDGDGAVVAELVRIQLRDEAAEHPDVDALCSTALDVAEPVAAALPAVG
ncbi:MAG TPA: serine/threonine-protein kinase [Promicromonospora sp.]|nr:serine/threonine-protein kinase [Promicromonospora sp.]